MPKEFMDAFRLPRDGFTEPVAFLNHEFGFSTSKDQRQDSRDFASLYKFYINETYLKNEVCILKPMTISVSYGEKTPDGITLNPKGIERRANWPIDLVSLDEFFYNIKHKTFYYKQKQISAPELLSMIEALHKKPTKFFRGFYLRLKSIFFRKILTGLIGYLYDVCVVLLHVFFGVRIKDSILMFNVRRDRSKDEINAEVAPLAQEKINIFGYQASGWAVVTYCIIHIVLYTNWYLYRESIEFDYFKTLFGNSFLTIIYVVPTLVIYERFISKKLTDIIKIIAMIHVHASFHRFKI